MRGKIILHSPLKKILGNLSRAPWEVVFPVEIPLGPRQSLRLLDILSREKGRFICVRAELNGVPVLAMVFFGRGAKAPFKQHMTALDCLRAGKLKLSGVDSFAHAGCFTVTLNTPESMGIVRDTCALAALPADVRKPIVIHIMRVLGSLHRAGVGSDALDIAGFLCAQVGMEYVPLQPLRRFSQSGSVPMATAVKNLGQIMAQLPPDFDQDLPEFCAAYAASAGVAEPSVAIISQLCFRYRCRYVRRRLADVENTSWEFVAFRTLKRVSVVSRCHLEKLREFLADPDGCMAEGEPLKVGTANTVVTVTLAGQRYTVKRYNLKNLRFVFTRLLKTSRPLKAWRAAHAFRFLGVATAKPIALLRERWGPLYFRAWVVMEHIDAPHFGEYFLNPQDKSTLVERDREMLLSFFRKMVAGSLSHGDLKCTNLLWHKTRGPISIDMDAARYHGCNGRSLNRNWRKDRRRFLRNWPAGTPFYSWLDRHLPPENPAGAGFGHYRPGAKP